jgi:hypothetical protein
MNDRAAVLVLHNHTSVISIFAFSLSAPHRLETRYEYFLRISYDDC